MSVKAVAKEQRRRFRETVNALRLERGMTQSELAAALEMPRSTLAGKLRGRTEVWWTDEFCMVLDVFRDEPAQRRLFEALSPKSVPTARESR